jgi:4a-hydroxytetrahydrobiopterin dehydratase
MDRAPLTADEIAILDTRLPGWACDGASLAREFTFAEFAEAFGFMTRVAEVAESLTTHSAGGLTGLDVALAEAMDRLAEGDSPG